MENESQGAIRLLLLMCPYMKLTEFKGAWNWIGWGQ